MNHRLRLFALVASLPLVAACSSQREMMATPVVFEGAVIDPFDELSDDEKTNEVSLFYVTNRPALGPAEDRDYGNGIISRLALGEVSVRLGNEDTTWDELYRASTTSKREKKIPLWLMGAREIGALYPEEEVVELPPDAARFAERINEDLDRAEWKDITVYAHGANIDFYGATVTSGELHHFMGRHGVMVAFDWPATQSALTYPTDVQHAEATVPVFVRFIEFLARHTRAEKINLIGYSAGAQIVSPGLALLREEFADHTNEELHELLRIGEVYYAAPDVDFHAFVVKHLPAYHEMTTRTTLTVNLKDKVLGLSASIFHKGSSRAGRPNLDELTEAETELVGELLGYPTFRVIDMGTAVPPPQAGARGGHAYWYKSPWVSADIIIQFIFHASPEERGLLRYESEGAPIWYYPEDYPERVISRLLAYLETLEEQEGADGSAE